MTTVSVATNASSLMMITAPMLGIVFFHGLALNRSLVLDLGVDTGNVGASVHGDANSHHGVPKHGSTVCVWKQNANRLEKV